MLSPSVPQRAIKAPSVPLPAISDELFSDEFLLIIGRSLFQPVPRIWQVHRAAWAYLKSQ